MKRVPATPHIVPALLAGFLLFGAAACVTAAPQPLPSRIEVNWSDPAQFTDTREKPGIGRDRPEEWLPQLAKHLQYRADRALPAGQHLNVTFTDVNRAGTYEPWRGARWDEVRIVKDAYPPRIDLHFSVTDAGGTVVGEGDRKLRDPGFLSRSIPFADDPLRFEKRMLDDWLRREFPKSDEKRS